MKRILIVLTSLSLIAGFVAATPAKVSAAPAQSTYDGGGIDYVVSQYGSLGGDTCENPDFRTIQDAVDEAERHALGSADSVIYVCNGVYHEEIDATLGLTLVGENRQKTILDGSQNEGDGIILAHDNVAVWDMTFRDGYVDNSVDRQEGEDGGAVYADDGVGPGIGDVTCRNSVFLSNSADDDGGAIWSTNDVDVQDCIFDGNDAGDNGGAVYAQSFFSSLRGTYTNNSSSNYYDGDGHGGAVRADDLSSSRLDLFANNHSESDGGAIWIEGDSEPALIDRSVFRQNESDQDGGAVFFDDDYELTITSSSFVNNTSGYSGGAIWLEGDDSDDYLDILGAPRAPTIFQGNAAAHSGGAIYVRDNEGTYGMSVTNARFIDNVAEWYGGAIRSNNEINLYSSTFNGNVARGSEFEENKSGGAVWGTEAIIVFRSTFTRNAAYVGDGGAIYAENNLSVTGSSFTSNTADDGGAILMSPFGDLTVEGSSFTANQAHGDEDEDGACVDDGPSFCEGAGGAINTYAEISTVTRSTFKNNSATDAGGAIAGFEDDGAALLRVFTSTFIGNQAEEAGAIASTELDLLELRGNLFQANRAYGVDSSPDFDYAVGAVFVKVDESDDSYVVVGNRFISNVGWGVGALYIVDDGCADSGDLFTAANMRANTWRSNRVTGGEPQSYRDVRHDGDFSGCGG